MAPCFAVGALRIGETYGMPTKPLVKTLFFTSVNLKHTAYTLKTSIFQDKTKDRLQSYSYANESGTHPFNAVASTKLNTNQHLNVQGDLPLDHPHAYKCYLCTNATNHD